MENECFWLSKYIKPNVINIVLANVFQNKLIGPDVFANRIEKTNIDILYKREYTFKDLIGDSKPLRFDFAIFKNDILYCLIEC